MASKVEHLFMAFSLRHSIISEVKDSISNMFFFDGLEREMGGVDRSGEVKDEEDVEKEVVYSASLVYSG